MMNPEKSARGSRGRGREDAPWRRELFENVRLTNPNTKKISRKSEMSEISLITLRPVQIPFATTGTDEAVRGHTRRMRRRLRLGSRLLLSACIRSRTHAPTQLSQLPSLTVCLLSLAVHALTTISPVMASPADVECIVGASWPSHDYITTLLIPHSKKYSELLWISAGDDLLYISSRHKVAFSTCSWASRPCRSSPLGRFSSSLSSDSPSTYRNDPVRQRR